MAPAHNAQWRRVVFCHFSIGSDGYQRWNFTLALILLGLGWNFLFLGATRAVGEVLAPSERARGQALNETLVFGVTALATFFAAALESWLGWFQLNLVMLVPVAIVFCLILVTRPSRVAIA